MTAITESMPPLLPALLLSKAKELYCSRDLVGARYQEKYPKSSPNEVIQNFNHINCDLKRSKTKFFSYHMRKIKWPRREHETVPGFGFILPLLVL